MAVFILLLVSLANLVFSAPTDSNTLNLSFHQSLNLSRKILQDVQNLLLKYKQEKIGNPSFEDYNLMLGSLPSCMVDYRSWLEQQDEERLLQNCRDLQVFWMHVDTKRVHELGQSQDSDLLFPMEAISLDLRDLISQLNSQISALNGSSPDTSGLTLPNDVLNPVYDWHSRLQGYIIFRDLEVYLNKVVRDFTVMRKKY